MITKSNQPNIVEEWFQLLVDSSTDVTNGCNKEYLSADDIVRISNEIFTTSNHSTSTTSSVRKMNDSDMKKNTMITPYIAQKMIHIASTSSRKRKHDVVVNQNEIDHQNHDNMAPVVTSNDFHRLFRT